MNAEVPNIYPTPKGITKAEVVINLLNDMLKYKLDIEAALGYSNHSHTFDDIVDMVVTGAAHFYFLRVRLRLSPAGPRGLVAHWLRPWHGAARLLS